MRTTAHDVLKTVSFQKTPSYIDLPDLLDIQTNSYEKFLQLDIPEDERQNIGLEEVFNNVFPIEDSYRNYVLRNSVIVSAYVVLYRIKIIHTTILPIRQ